MTWSLKTKILQKLFRDLPMLFLNYLVTKNLHFDAYCSKYFFEE
jgi:hypothetical protein